MHFLLDVHMPISLSKFLDKQVGCACIHTNQILQKWLTKDENLSKHADENDLILITKDWDFKNSHILKNTPKKVIRVTLGNLSSKELISVFEKHLPTLKSLLSRPSFYIELSAKQLTIYD